MGYPLATGLPRRHDVRLESAPLEAPEVRAAAPEPVLHFVGDNERAGRAHRSPRPRQPQARGGSKIPELVMAVSIKKCRRRVASLRQQGHRPPASAGGGGRRLPAEARRPA